MNILRILLGALWLPIKFLGWIILGMRNAFRWLGKKLGVIATPTKNGAMKGLEVTVGILVFAAIIGLGLLFYAGVGVVAAKGALTVCEFFNPDCQQLHKKAWANAWDKKGFTGPLVQPIGMTSWRPVSGKEREEILALIHDIATAHEIDPKLVATVVKHESAFDPRAVSHKGAVGLMQLMPGTAKDMGVRDPYDPYENLRGGIRYLKQQLQEFGSVELALAAYNAGPHRVKQYGNTIPPYPETQTYVSKITSEYRAL